MDFLASMKPLLKQVKEKGIKVVTNAGGVNPEACAKQLAAIAADQGVDLSIALVEGDNLMGNVSGKNSSMNGRGRGRERGREREREEERGRERERKRERSIHSSCTCILQYEEVKSMGVMDIDTGQPLPPDVQSMSAYLGYEWPHLDFYFKSGIIGLFYALLSPSPL